MSKLPEKIKYWLGLFQLPVYALSHLVIRDKSLWLFGSTFGRRFTDNPRYLFIYVSSLAEDDVRAVWISHDKEIVRFLNGHGFEAYYYRSLKGMLLELLGGVYIYDNYSKDISFPLSGGAVKVNLWHGVGNKRINHDNVHDKVRHPKNLYEGWCTLPRRMSDEKPGDYVLCTSKEMGEYFALAFKSRKGHVLCEGYPRCDTLFDEGRRLLEVMTDEEQALSGRIDAFMDEHPGGRIIAYLPTFRESESRFSSVMDMEAFDRFLAERDYLFVVKPHPKSVIKAQLTSISSKNVAVADSSVDVYTFLGRADMLVTDYSSVYTDYMLTARPVVAFCYDSEAYETNSRDYFIDQRRYMPEVVAVDMKGLMDAIDGVFERDECLPLRLKSRERMFDIAGGGACERVYKRIRGIVK